jgi:hypothetical protein
VNNQGPELSPEARRIISEARGVDDPTSDDQDRVKARWLASVAAIAGVSSLTEAARAAGGIGWGLKAAGAALVLAAGAVGLSFALQSDGAHAPGSPSPASTSPANDEKRADAPGWSGSTHARFEKTSAGERHALEQTAQHGPDQRSVDGRSVDRSVDAVTPTPALPSLPAAQPGLNPGIDIDPAKVPAISALPGPVVEAAPSVLEPAEVPMREGNALDVGVEAPATEASAALPVRAEAAASPQKLARREPAAARAAVPRAPVARAHPVPRAPVPRAHPVKATPAVVKRAPAAPAASPNAPSGQLGEELTLLSSVRSSVQDGAPGRALELLSSYRSRFGRPILGMEADALKVDALCKSGQREAAQASARAFQNDWPGSPLERRVRSACP